MFFIENNLIDQTKLEEILTGEVLIDKYLKGKNIATEIERMYAIGRVTPNLWMQRAVGADVSVEPLLKATETAVINIKNADKNSKKNSKKGK